MELKEKKPLNHLYTSYGRKNIDLIVELYRKYPNTKELFDQAYRMFGKNGINILDELRIIEDEALK